jgi:hypothetical protein
MKVEQERGISVTSSVMQIPRSCSTFIQSLVANLPVFLPLTVPASLIAPLKTTLTEKLLYFSGAIREAGTVKGKKTGKFATSDWMKVEQERGISVTSSVMQFDYDDYKINIFLPLTVPASLIAPLKYNNFSVSVVLPASG